MKSWLATAMLVLLVGCMEDVADAEEEGQLPEAAAPPLATIDRPPATIDPGISLRERRDTRDAVGWQITNTRDAPVTIHVLFNGEWEPPIAKIMYGGGGAEYWFPSEQLLPRTLTIGESYLLYGRKEVVYIDLYTDRGNFRYRPLEGFEALAD